MNTDNTTKITLADLAGLEAQELKWVSRERKGDHPMSAHVHDFFRTPDGHVMVHETVMGGERFTLYSPAAAAPVAPPGAAQDRPADMGHHGFPHAGPLQGVTDHIIGMIRADAAAAPVAPPVAIVKRGLDGKSGPLLWIGPVPADDTPLYAGAAPVAPQPPYSPHFSRIVRELAAMLQLPTAGDTFLVDTDRLKPHIQNIRDAANELHKQWQAGAKATGGAAA